MAVPARRRPVQRRAQEMVERILDASAQVLATDGYAAMSTNRVAAEAEVSVGSLYRYFADKADLVEQLRLRVNEEVLGELTEAVLAAADQAPAAGVRHILETLVGALERNRGVMAALIDEVPLGSQANTLPEVEHQLAQFTRFFFLRHAPALDRAEVDARIYLGMGVTLNACLRIALEKPPELDRDHLVDLTVEMLLSGLRG